MTDTISEIVRQLRAAGYDAYQEYGRAYVRNAFAGDHGSITSVESGAMVRQLLERRGRTWRTPHHHEPSTLRPLA